MTRIRLEDGATFEVVVEYVVRPSGIVWLVVPARQPGPVGRFIERAVARLLGFVPKRTNHLRLDPMGSEVVKAMAQGKSLGQIAEELDDGTPDFRPRLEAFVAYLMDSGFVRTTVARRG